MKEHASAVNREDQGNTSDKIGCALSLTERTAGSLYSEAPLLSAEQEREVVERAIAEEVMHSMRRA